jgi:hypothetical protein
MHQRFRGTRYFHLQGRIVVGLIIFTAVHIYFTVLWVSHHVEIVKITDVSEDMVALG